MYIHNLYISNIYNKYINTYYVIIIIIYNITKMNQNAPPISSTGTTTQDPAPIFKPGDVAEDEPEPFSIPLNMEEQIKYEKKGTYIIIGALIFIVIVCILIVALCLL